MRTFRTHVQESNMAESIDVGKRFSDYATFKTAFDHYCGSEGLLYCKNGKTIESANRIIKKASLHFKKEFVYSTIRFECKHFGDYESKSQGKRKQQRTYKIGCKAFLRLSADRKLNAMVITEMVNEHNHPTASAIDPKEYLPPIMDLDRGYGANDTVLLYAHSSTKNLAKQIAETCTNGFLTNSQDGASLSPKRVVNTDDTLRPERAERLPSFISHARHVEFRDTIQWKKFEDGFPNLFIEDVKHMAGKDVIFIGSFHAPEVVFEQLSVLYAFPRYLAKSFHFILPYFPTGTMERVDTEGQIATAKTLATLLSAIPLSAKGPAQIIIYDIHALQERFYFSDNVIPRLETAVPMLQHALDALPDKDNIMIAFPDDGAYKRFHLLFPDDSKVIVCTKKRVEGNKRIVSVKDGNPDGKHVVIVDDLVQTGGTLRECGKALLKGGAVCVSAYVTHAVFPKNSWENFTKDDPPFKNFWITDSLPHAQIIAQHPPFQLLSLSNIIAENLLGFDLAFC